MDEKVSKLHVSGPDAPPAQGKPVLAETPTAEEVQVALGDDAEGAVGSDAPMESEGVDTGDQ